jgi:hypothetical protein
MQLAPGPFDRPTVLKGDDMFRTRFVFGFSVLFLAAGIVVTAQGHSNGPKSTHTTAAPKAPAPAPHPATKTAPVKPAKAPQPTMKAQHPSTPAKAPQPTMKAQHPSTPAKTQKVDKPPTKQTAKAATKPAKPEKTATSTKTTTGTTTTAELTPVQQKLKQNTNLAAKVASRLPQGTDLMAAAAGFRNLGQFVAAANVSNNLQISFTELKAKMMTGMSLGQAIQAVRPLTASPTVEAQRAEYDARGLIAESEHEQSTTASSSAVPSATPTSTTAKPRVKTKNSAQ